MKIFFFPNKNFSIPSVTNVKALLCPDPFFIKIKNFKNQKLFWKNLSTCCQSSDIPFLEKEQCNP